MVQRTAGDNPEGVTALLRFAARFSDSVPSTQHEVRISNGRLRPQTTLDREGFLLSRHDSGSSNFYDDVQVRNLYYPEVTRFVRDITGATFVTAFIHTLRCDAASVPSGLRVERPFQFVHNDYTSDTGPKRVREALGDQVGELMQRRFSIINVWRPIIGPVEQWHLAVCDTSSVSPSDLVSLPSRDPSGRTIRIYTLAFNPAQRWCYFPGMTTDEVLVFKTFDSVADGRSRYTFHSAFEDSAEEHKEKPRHSIEVRTVAVF